MAIFFDIRAFIGYHSNPLLNYWTGSGQIVASNKKHHASKSNRFLLVLAREEAEATAKSYRIVPWMLASGIVLTVLLIGIGFYAVITITPIATLIPLPNPALENKYGRELLALNQSVMGLMEEMVQLRAYNVKLRSALGEKVTTQDSASASFFDEIPPRIEYSQPKHTAPSQQGITVGGEPIQEKRSNTVIQVVDRMSAVAFPAILPVQGFITRGFAAENGHYGLDVAAKTGSVVSAAADGIVLFSGWTEDDGNMLMIAHSGGFVTVYKHNQSLLRSVGIGVKRGEAVATVGNTGRTSYGPHLHFEIWKDGVPADPAYFVLNLSM